MYVLVGLGNPGDKYMYTRHNAGYIFLDHLAQKFSLVFKDSKWQALQVKTNLYETPVLLVKPITFMNLSGQAVRAVTDYYRVSSKKIILIHDDLDLPLGRIKIVTGRGAGGHKGVVSIINHLGRNDFSRIKIGISRPPAEIPPDRYVLARMNSDEYASFLPINDHVEEAVRFIIEKGISTAMNKVNAA